MSCNTALSPRSARQTCFPVAEGKAETRLSKGRACYRGEGAGSKTTWEGGETDSGLQVQGTVKAHMLCDKQTHVGGRGTEVQGPETV